ncbi:hypothetical protein C8R45DRAFT_180432 [Mycena sanguinolenta]|nr:hypothetical protein C8R45DRAFT_180432 [Mycena sanguinolenta]
MKDRGSRRGVSAFSIQVFYSRIFAGVLGNWLFVSLRFATRLFGGVFATQSFGEVFWGCVSAFLASFTACRFLSVCGGRGVLWASVHAYEWVVGNSLVDSMSFSPPFTGGVGSQPCPFWACVCGSRLGGAFSGVLRLLCRGLPSFLACRGANLRPALVAGGVALAHFDLASELHFRSQGMRPSAYRSGCVLPLHAHAHVFSFTFSWRTPRGGVLRPSPPLRLRRRRRMHFRFARFRERDCDCVVPSLYRIELPEYTISKSPSPSREMTVSSSTTLKASSQGMKGIYRESPTLFTVDLICRHSLINCMPSSQRNIMFVVSLLILVPQGLCRNTFCGRPTLRARCRKKFVGISGKPRTNWRTAETARPGDG